MPGASEEGKGQWHAGAGRAQGSVSPMESEGSKRETVKGALRERLRFSPGMLDRVSIWPGRSSELSTGFIFLEGALSGTPGV